MNGCNRVVIWGALSISGLLSACGQTGALQLPSDPSYDKRAQYLLYKTPQQANAADAKNEPTDAPASAVASQP